MIDLSSYEVQELANLAFCGQRPAIAESAKEVFFGIHMLCPSHVSALAVHGVPGEVSINKTPR